jgi:hypothetical protein
MERLYLIESRSLLSFLIIYNTDIVKVFGHPSITSITKKEYINGVCLNDKCAYIGEV